MVLSANTVEHGLIDARECGSNGFQRQRSFEGVDGTPVGALHLSSGRGEVDELNLFVAARVAGKEAEPVGAIRREDKVDEGRAIKEGGLGGVLR